MNQYQALRNSIDIQVARNRVLESRLKDEINKRVQVERELDIHRQWMVLMQSLVER